jgi:hypothetical protein
VTIQPKRPAPDFAPHFEAVKKSTSPVILSEAKNLQLFVFKKINADASLRSESVTFFDLAEKWH